MDEKGGIALRKMIHHKCDGHKSMECDYDFDVHDLRFGKETVGRGMGFFCLKCFEEHCAGKSWEHATTLAGSIVESGVLGVYSVILEPDRRNDGS